MVCRIKAEVCEIFAATSIDVDKPYLYYSVLALCSILYKAVEQGKLRAEPNLAGKVGTSLPAPFLKNTKGDPLWAALCETFLNLTAIARFLPASLWGL